jgi:hypothetical protein
MSPPDSTLRPALRLPPLETAREVLGIAWQGKWRWLGLTWLPLLLGGIAVAILRAALGMAAGHPAPNTLSNLLTGLCLIPAVTAWMRYVIGGERDPGLLRYRLGAPEGWYLLRYLQLTLMVAAILLVAALSLLGLARIGYWEAARFGGEAMVAAATPAAWVEFILLVAGAITVLGVMFWLAAAYVLTLPAAAMGGALGDMSSFRASADLTRGHRWSIIAIGLLVSLAGALAVGLIAGVGLLGFVLAQTVLGPGLDLLALVWGLGLVVALVLSTMVAAALHPTALACIYRRLRAAPAP